MPSTRESKKWRRFQIQKISKWLEVSRTKERDYKGDGYSTNQEVSFPFLASTSSMYPINSVSQDKENWADFNTLQTKELVVCNINSDNDIKRSDNFLQLNMKHRVSQINFKYSESQPNSVASKASSVGSWDKRLKKSWAKLSKLSH